MFLSCRLICSLYSWRSVSSDIGRTNMAAVEQMNQVTALEAENTHLILEADLETVVLTASRNFSGNISLNAKTRSTMVSSSKKSSIVGGVSIL